MTDKPEESADDLVDDDRTRIGVMAPVVTPPRLAPQAAASSAAAVDAGDRTQVLPVQPPALRGMPDSRLGSEGAADRTQLFAGPAPVPVMSPGPTPAAAAASPVVAPPGAANGKTAAVAELAAASAIADTAPRVQASIDDDRTVVLRRVESKLKLVRVPPSGGSTEPILLDRPKLVIGRGRNVDIKLFSPTASREHARLQEIGGKWTIESMDGRSVYIDDVLAEAEIELQPGMKIRLGDDELVVTPANAGATAGANGLNLFEKLLSWWKTFRSRVRG